MIKSTKRIGLLAVALFVVSGCSSTPKPRTEIALSGEALQNAEVAGAAKLAPLELRSAKEKQDLAEAAMQRDKYTTAKRLSEQAAVDAELAKAKAEAEKSRLAVTEVEDSIRLIRTELDRGNGK